MGSRERVQYSVGRCTIAGGALVHWMVDGIDTQGISTAAKVHDRLQIRFTVYLHLSITIVLIIGVHSHRLSNNRTYFKA